MKVDIIMPTHNPGAFILEALESCMIQTYKDIKVTVINDCSTTDVSYLKKKFPKINLIKTPTNLGPGGARNYGIKNTSGDIISFLDDDDVMDMNKILWSVQEFKKNSKIGMTCGNYRILVHGRLRPPFYRKAPVINWETMMRQNWVASGSVSVRRSTFEKVGLFSEEYWIAEDYDAWIRTMEISEAKYIPRVLYFYRIIPNGNSLTQRSDIQENHIKNINKIRAESRKRMGK
jgi:glycosyltransferase involved in cell wall biosynthesis